MKKVFLLLIITSLFATANAQIKFGVKGGISSSTIKMDDIITVQGVEEYSLEGIKSGTVGFHAGLMTRVTFFGVYIQPELYFSSTGGDVEVSNLITNDTEIKTMEFKKLDIPVLVGFKFGPARVNAGPVASIIIDSKADLIEKAGYEENLKGASFGYQAGVGLDLLKTISLDIRYEGNLSKLGDGVNIGGEDFEFDSRNPQFIFSLGIFF
ncbi:MAG: PorT family protein [Bacteroidetes bacterium]|nr:PorT family protein [Bacteroidota bacterium]